MSDEVVIRDPKNPTKTIKISKETLRKLFFTRCTSRDMLKNWIQYFLGLHLPDCTVSRYSTSNPFEFIWEMYNLLVNGYNPQKIQEVITVAGRGSGKCQSQGTNIIVKSCKAICNKKIENVKVGDKVWTGWNWKKVLNTFDEGILDGVKVETKNKTIISSSVHGSTKHRLLGLNEEGMIDWLYMKDLKPGDLLYKSIVDIDVDTNSEDFELGYIVGNIAGDGCVKPYSYTIELCTGDMEHQEYFITLLQKHFKGIRTRVRKNSGNSNNILIGGKEFHNFIKSYLDGYLCYHKKLKTTQHSANFLAGFVSGMMETDGYIDGITLANRDLIYQMQELLTFFGVRSGVKDDRRPPRYSQYLKAECRYYECRFLGKLPTYLWPKFSKGKAFEKHQSKMNDQYRYSVIPIKKFGAYIRKKYSITRGRWVIDGVKSRSNTPLYKELFGNSGSFIYGYKIDEIIKLAKFLKEDKWAENLKLYRNGYLEEVKSVEFLPAYFYDLEVEDDHSYWSNGFISHNTLGVAVIEFLAILHGKRNVAHVGAIMSQAKRCSDYIAGYIVSEKIKPILTPSDKSDPTILTKNNMEKSIFDFGDERCSFEIIPCTLKAVNGLHVSLLSVDEVDTISGENLKGYQDLQGSLDTRGDKKALRINISTRKTRYGLMNKQIENANQKGKALRKWTAFEFHERCPDSKSGTIPYDYFINQDDMECITQKQYDDLQENKKTNYAKYTMFNGCKKCGLAPICLGDLKKQVSQSPMLKPIEELEKKVLSEDKDWALSQLMNLKPATTGIVFKEYDSKKHIKNWNEMWKIVTGQDYPRECDQEIFVRKCHSLNIPCYCGIDWGWSNPTTATFIFVLPNETILVVKNIGMTYTSDPTFIHIIKTQQHRIFRPQLYFPDVALPGNMVEMTKQNLPVSNTIKKEPIQTGIQLIKRLLAPPGMSEPKLYIHESCRGLIEEFEMYHFKTDNADNVLDEPADEFNDHLDGFRYAVTGVLGKTAVVMDDYNPNRNTFQTYNPLEMASSLGVNINESDEYNAEDEIPRGGFVFDF